MGGVAALGPEDDFPRIYLAATAIVGYALAAPIVHVANGKARIAAVSFGTRISLPPLGAVVAATVARGDREADIRAGAVGALVGAGMAIALDASLLAWKNEVSPTPRTLVERSHPAPKAHANPRARRARRHRDVLVASDGRRSSFGT